MPCTNCNIAGHNKRTCPWKKCEICQELFANTENSKIIEDKDGMKLACFNCWNKIEEKEKEKEVAKCVKCKVLETDFGVTREKIYDDNNITIYGPTGELMCPDCIADEEKEEEEKEERQEIEYLINGGDWCDSD